MLSTTKLHNELTLIQKIQQISWVLLVLIFLLAGIGFTSLYSAAGGNIDPWASKQILRFCIGFTGMILVALINVKWWYYFSYHIYIVGLLSLIVVEIFGHTGMGAQRWIDLGFIQIQPSEFMKIAVVLALARYFHLASFDDMKSLRFLFRASLLIILPFILVLFQPDLGTALMIAMSGIVLFFVAGAPIWIFILGGIIFLASIPIVWNFLHDYQKQRIITFINPESDPLGAGYHIMQSKIAIGSGGVGGKGFLEGTQSKLNFLPEKQTDFIFTLWVEEWGLLGGGVLLILVGLIILYCLWVSLKCRHFFGKLLSLGLTVNFFLYVFINISMVMGLIPVVGAPLPLVSYGGTSMLAVLFGFGLILSCKIYKDSKVLRI